MNYTTRDSVLNNLKEGTLHPSKAFRWAIFKQQWDIVCSLNNVVNKETLDEILITSISKVNDDVAIYVIPLLGTKIDLDTIGVLFRTISNFKGRKEILKLLIENQVKIEYVDSESIVWCFKKLLRVDDFESLDVLMSYIPIIHKVSNIDIELYNRLLPLIRTKKLNRIKEKLNVIEHV